MSKTPAQAEVELLRKRRKKKHIEYRDGESSPPSPPKDDGLVRVTMTFTKEEWQKLNDLAAYQTKNLKKTMTPEKCIKGFIKYCVTNGGDWRHPSER